MPSRPDPPARDPGSRVLVANRGEVAVRVARGAADLGLTAVAVVAGDDPHAPHARAADETVRLPGRGVGAFLDADALVDAARLAGCGLLHPGWGFLAESGDLARACAAAGVRFAGPSPEALDLLGDKTAARALAARLGLPLLPATDPADGAEGLAAAARLLDGLGPDGAVVVKARSGGGGRGIRVVRDAEALPGAWERCAAEARAASGRPDLYAEQWLARARHVEVQVLGDGTGAVATLGDRDCSVQRRHQKLVEVAPAPGLPGAVRAALADAARRLARAVSYAGVGTVEFLVAPGGADPAGWRWVFLEVNPRLQVEHTVTEQVTGVDLVRAQLDLARGRSLADLGLDAGRAPAPRGCAVQVRLNAETVAADGTVGPSSGVLAAFDPPSGPGVRVDTAVRAGDRVDPRFDSLLAKVVVTGAPGDGVAAVVARAARALAATRVEGVATNRGLLRALLDTEPVRSGTAWTTLVDDDLPALLAQAAALEPGPGGSDAAGRVPAAGADAVPPGDRRPEPPLPLGAVAVRAPLLGTVTAVEAAPGDAVGPTGPLVVLESMKMEHPVAAGAAAVVREVVVRVGETVAAGQLLAVVDPDEGDAAAEAVTAVDLDVVRPDLAEVLGRRAAGLDAARPAAVARRRRTGQRTARENVDDLVDAGSLVEYGALLLAAQRTRRGFDDLVARTPADGLVAGVGTVNAERVGADAARCLVLAYDYTVLAGTQGHLNHRKKDRLFALAERERLPVVLFAEGGGGRPGDTDDATVVSALGTPAFSLFARLSGLVPLVGVVSGRCFAGNAALLGTCDVVIATRDATVGMGGPAMIEGGGLGVVRPEDVGPVAVQAPNGVVDVVVDDEAEAVRVARQYLGYFQGPVTEWSCADQRLLRSAVPENRLRAYDVRSVVDVLADTGSVLELRRDFGVGVVTALVRVEGRPFGLVANDCRHLGGAIDADAADKAARFLQLCDAFGLPVVSLCDTPGFMVGPDAERTATVRHFARLFVHGANLDVPVGLVVLRKAYGLGAQAMAGGSLGVPAFSVAWPTGEFGPMGVEGAVRLGYRDELAAVEDPAEREERFAAMVAASYERGKALNVASVGEIDDVIDPAETRRWIAARLRPRPRGEGKRRPCVDTW